jgi:hypothetical protein
MEKSPTFKLKRVEINAATITRATMALNMIEETFIVSEAEQKKGRYCESREIAESDFPIDARAAVGVCQDAKALYWFASKICSQVGKRDTM